METREKHITVIKIFDAITVSASGTALSELIDLGSYTANGEMSIEFDIK